MLNDIIVIGVVMSIVELIKHFARLDKKDYGHIVVPLLVFIIAGASNVINAQIFGDMALVEALKEGLILGASAGGIYGMGKSIMEGNKEV